MQSWQIPSTMRVHRGRGGGGRARGKGQRERAVKKQLGARETEERNAPRPPHWFMSPLSTTVWNLRQVRHVCVHARSCWSRYQPALTLHESASDDEHVSEPGKRSEQGVHSFVSAL